MINSSKFLTSIFEGNILKKAFVWLQKDSHCVCHPYSSVSVLQHTRHMGPALL